jgi:hypothetical protein
MKQIIVLLIIILPTSVLAQRFKGGIVAGFNASQIDGDFYAGYYKAGLMGGAYVFTEFNDKWKGQMEIRYSAKGSATPPHYSFQDKYVLRYIEVPIIIDFEMFKKLELQAGMSIGYLFYAGEYDGYGYEKITDELRATESAICVGLNYSVFDPLNLNIRYSYSLFPVFSDYPGQSYGTGAWYNNVITFGLYYRIGKRSL